MVCFQKYSNIIKECVKMLIDKEEINGIEFEKMLGKDIESSINYEHFNSGY